MITKSYTFESHILKPPPQFQQHSYISAQSTAQQKMATRHTSKIEKHTKTHKQKYFHTRANKIKTL